MTAEEYLKQYNRIYDRVQIIQKTLEQLRTDAESTSISLDGMPKGSNTNDRMARLAVKLVEYETELSAEMSALWSKRMEIINTIGRLDHRHQLILFKRYIERDAYGKELRWEQIAVDLGITWRHCHRLHRRALAELDKILNK